jgi:hypothetical protein
MKTIIVNGTSLPSIPFEERKEKGESPLWRYSANPVTKRNPAEGISRIFNSGVSLLKADLRVFSGANKMMASPFYMWDIAKMVFILVMKRAR